MNPNQKKVLFGYIAVLALMLLFPPTVIKTTVQIFSESGITYDSHSASGGFRFIAEIGNHSGTPSSDDSIAMDLTQLSIQIVIVSLIAGAAYVAVKEAK